MNEILIDFGLKALATYGVYRIAMDFLNWAEAKCKARLLRKYLDG